MAIPEKLRRDFVDGGIATDTLDTYEYSFGLPSTASQPAVLERRALVAEEWSDAARSTHASERARVIAV